MPVKQMDAVIQKMEEKYIQSFWNTLDTISRERKYLSFTEAPPIAFAERFIKENLSKGHSQFIATLEDRVLGWCDILPYEFEGHRHCGYLGMGVLAEYRGQGIGKKLTETAIEDAWKKGISRIELEVYASNIGAIKLYEKVGFVHEGIKKKKRYLDNVWDDNLLMALFKEENS